MAFTRFGWMISYPVAFICATGECYKYIYRVLLRMEYLHYWQLIICIPIAQVVCTTLFFWLHGPYISAWLGYCPIVLKSLKSKQRCATLLANDAIATTDELTKILKIFCSVLAAKNLSDTVYDNFLDHSFLADRKTTIREYLSTSGSGIMEEEPPEELKHRYGGWYELLLNVFFEAEIGSWHNSTMEIYW